MKRFTLSWDLPSFEHFSEELDWNVNNWDEVAEVLASWGEEGLTNIFGTPEFNIEN